MIKTLYSPFRKWTEIGSERHLNVCAEHIDYYPVNVNRLLKKGLLSGVNSIHRITIDRANERKLERESED